MLKESFRRWTSKTAIVAGITIGVVLAAHFAHAGSLRPLNSVTADVFTANPQNTLRVLQSVGILLPLFTGLLRFTTSDYSEVSEQVNDQLLLGILGLVLAGSSAAIAGVSTDLTGILQFSLLCVLLTFIVVGRTAVAMFGGFATGSKDDKGTTEGTDTHEEDPEDEAKTADSDDAKGATNPEGDADFRPEPNQDEQDEE